MSKSLALLLTAIPATQAAWHWSKGTNVCAGIQIPCTDATSCSTVAVGPCEGAAKAPTAYLQSNVVGLAFVDVDNYLDAATGKTAADAGTYKVVDPDGKGFRDYKEGVVVGDSKMAYIMGGTYLGGATTGGYAGMTSILNTGTKDITTNKAKVFLAKTPAAAQVDRSAGTGASVSKEGAPDGPYEVCISEIDATTKACGAARTFKPDEYKFSIFGAIFGSDFDTTVVAGQNGFPAKMNAMGVRMKMKATGFKVTDLKINGKTWEKGSVATDVTSMTIMHADGGLSVAFPQKYNIGTTADLAGIKTATIKIRVSNLDTTAQTFDMDYLFDTDDIKFGQYFIYDPAVTDLPKGTAPAVLAPGPAPSATNSAGTSATIAAATISAVAAVAALLM